MSNFWQRAITGALFVGIIIAAIIFNIWVFRFVFGLVVLLGLNEFYGLFKDSKTTPNRIVGLILGMFIYLSFSLSFHLEEYKMISSAAVTLSFGLVALTELYRKKEKPFENVAVTLAGLIYIVIPFILLNFLFEFNHETGSITDFWPVLSIFILVWCSDTFAYLVGRQIGKHKLFERISPKKSWEGFFGGMLFAILGGILIAYFTEQSYLQYAIYGIVISTVGTLGDLVESMLKRSLNIKDSGNILPGHGGILDRFDAVLFVIPFIFVLHHYIF